MVKKKLTREERILKDLNELIKDLKKNYYVPPKFRSLSSREWDVQRPGYIRYLERRLERFQGMM